MDMISISLKYSRNSKGFSFMVVDKTGRKPVCNENGIAVLGKAANTDFFHRLVNPYGRPLLYDPDAKFTCIPRREFFVLKAEGLRVIDSAAKPA